MLIGFETKVLVIIVNKIVHALASITLSDRASDVGLFLLVTSLFIHLLLLVYHVPLLCLTIMLPFVRPCSVAIGSLRSTAVAPLHWQLLLNLLHIIPHCLHWWFKG